MLFLLKQDVRADIWRERYDVTLADGRLLKVSQSLGKFEIESWHKGWLEKGKENRIKLTTTQLADFQSSYDVGLLDVYLTHV